MSQVLDSHLVLVFKTISQCCTVNANLLNAHCRNNFIYNNDNFSYTLVIERRVDQIINLSDTSSVGQKTNPLCI